MASYIKNLLKQLPFYEKTIKLRIKKFTTAKFKHNVLKVLCFLSQEFFKLFTCKVCIFCKKQAIFNISRIFKIQNVKLLSIALHEHRHKGKFLNSH